MHDPDTAFVPLPFDRLAEPEMRTRADEILRRLRRRRSVRDFATDPVPRELIETAIACACTAPSGANRQPWHFVAISNPELKRRVRDAAEAEEHRFYEGGRTPDEWLEAISPLGTGPSKTHLTDAPWLVAVFKEIHGVAGDGSKITNYYVNESVGIACGLFITALQWMGLATLTHTPQPMRFLNQLLDRPTNERPYILFPVGYPAADCKVPVISKKPLDDVTTWYVDD